MKLYFDDLTKEAQQAFLKQQGIEDKKEGNYDIVPIAEI